MMTEKSKHPAKGARILSTGIAIASTIGISNIYMINAQAKYLESINSSSTAQVPTVDSTVLNPVVAPTTPQPAKPLNKKSLNNSTTTDIFGGAIPQSVVVDTIPQQVDQSTLPSSNLIAQPVPTNTATPVVTLPAPVTQTTLPAPVTQIIIPPTTAPKTSASK
jgi:hypothetical protein